MTGQSVNPVPAQPPRYGLLVAAPVASSPSNAPAGVRWQQGIAWNPEACGVSGRVSVDCDGTTDSLTTARNGRIVEADPFAVWASDECSPFGFQSRDWSGRALRQLEATQSYQIANELWTGDLHISDGLEGGFLTDHASLTVAYALTASTHQAAVIDALACTEQAIAACSEGRRGMVHMTPAALVQLKAAFAVDLVGTQILTPLGNIVVADAGYDGSGPGGKPAGSTQWMYGTGIIAVTLEASPMLVPGDLAQAQAMAQALKRTDNTLTVRAMKLAMYQWDRCCHVACEFDLPTCAVGS